MKKLLTTMGGSVRSPMTTIGGLMSAVGAAIVGIGLTPGLDVSVPGWLIIVAVILSAAGPALMGVSSRDHDVTSEEAMPKKHGDLK